MIKVSWIFVHTAAFKGAANVEKIRRWHMDKGWNDIGYHYVIRRDGRVEIGRPNTQRGAHVYGANAQSIGICCEGHGDFEDHTTAQREALIALCRVLLRKYKLTPYDVLGHREVNQLVEDDILPETIADRPVRTDKTCPGTKVDMEAIRDALWPEPQPVDSMPRAA